MCEFSYNDLIFLNNKAIVDVPKKNQIILYI